MTGTVRREPPNHDTTTCYTHYRCRRPACVDRYNAHGRDRNRLKREGTYQRFTEAAPVRDHLLPFIAAGATPHRIATCSQVSDTVVRSLLATPTDSGRKPLKHRLFTENAEKLLALQPEDVIPRFVPALGTCRRLQALVANGWPMKALAPRVSLQDRYVSALISRASLSGDAQVTGGTALNVARAYEGLRRKNPARNGVTRQAIAQVRNLAKDRDWPPTRYWDQFPGALDDPHFTPEYGKTRLEILAEDASWVLAGGHIDRDLIADRLGVHRSYLDRAVAAHAASGTEVAA